MEQQKHTPAPMRAWVKWLLVGSLALNFAVLGVGGGMAWRYSEGLRDERSQPRGRDMGYGPLTAAMTRDDWQAMRPAFIARNPDLRAGAEALSDDFDLILKILRSEPFAAESFDQALRDVAQRNMARLESSGAVIGSHIKGMNSKQREAYADRLGKIISRAKQRHKHVDEPRGEGKEQRP